MTSLVRLVFVIAAASVGCAAIVACDSFSSSNDAPPGVDASTSDGSTNGGDSSAADAPTPCGDTASDPKNCGVCGHDCMGGACVAGKCQAALLTTTIEPVPWLVLDATRVIWLTSTAPYGRYGSVYTCPKATGCGGAPTALVSNFRGGALGSDGTTAYVSNTGPGAPLGLAKVGGSGLDTYPAFTNDGIFWITPRGDELLVNEYKGGGDFPRTIYRARLAFGELVRIASFNGDNTAATTYTADHVYIGAHNVPKVYAAPLSGDGGFIEVASNEYVASMTSSADRVYYVNEGAVYSCAGDGNVCTTIRTELPATSAKFAGSPSMVLFAEGRLFVATSGGDILMCEPNGSCLENVTTVVHENTIATDWKYTGHNIAVDDRAVYYVAREGTDADSGFTYFVKRIATPPKSRNSK